MSNSSVHHHGQGLQHSPSQSMVRNHHQGGGNGGISNSNSSNNLSPPSLPPHAIALEQKQRSFLTFGFGAGGSGPSRRESHVNVNVTPTSHDAASDTPEIRKYKKRFNSEILCAALWGVNLLIGSENGLMLLDRSGQGKVRGFERYSLKQLVDILSCHSLCDAIIQPIILDQTYIHAVDVLNIFRV